MIKFILGVFVGFFCAGLCYAAKDRDEAFEYIKEREKSENEE